MKAKREKKERMRGREREHEKKAERRINCTAQARDGEKGVK